MRAVSVVALSVVTAFTLACLGGGSSTPEPAAPEPAAEPAPAAVDPADADPPPTMLPPVDLDGPEDRSECMIEDPGSWKPLLAEVQPDGSKVVVTRGRHGIAETVKRADGSEVRIQRGGCSHVGETLMFAPSDNAPPHTVAKRLFSELTLRDPSEPPSLSRCVDDVPADASGGWSCGDAYVSVQDEMGRLELTWSFAL
jgi:hypothetical protein